MHLKVKIVALLSVGIVGISFAQEYSCDYVINREKLLQGKPNCGDGQCRCVGDIARCVGNRKTSVVPPLESINKDITELYVECYGMPSLTSTSFVNIETIGLRSIHLLRNEIGNMSEDIFQRFDRLTSLEISDNAKINITSLKSALGSLNKSLPMNLTFNNIGMDNLTDAFFRNLNKSNVIYLSLEGNRITTLNLTVIRQLSSLRELRMKENWITGVKGTEQLERIHKLDLRQNRVHRDGVNFCLPDNGSMFPNIKTLLLSNNLLGKQDMCLRSINCLTSLEILDLRNNTIKTLNSSIFSNLTSLKTLNVGSNWIQDVEAGEFPEKVTEIDFRNNQFVIFPPVLCSPNSSRVFENIKILNFSRNYIQHIMTNYWSCLPNITVLDFSKNDVSELKNNTFSNFTSLTELYLDNMIPWVTRIEPVALNSSSLQTLSVRFDWIDFRKKEMQGIFAFCPNVKKIDISYNYFYGVNESTIVDILSPMKGLEILKAQRISLKAFPAKFLEKFENLKYLDINRNLLFTIQFTDFFNNPQLNLSIRYISAAEGDINLIDKSAFPVSILNSLERLDLSENEFACTCEMEWFRKKIENGRIGKIQLAKWPDKYVCRSPTGLVNTLFKDYKPVEDCWKIKPVTVAIIAVCSSLLVFSVISVTAYFNKWYLQYYWYKFIRRRREAKVKAPEDQSLLDEIQYDAYVVYNSADADFVHHPFRQLVENKLNYKLHIWERNAANGALVDVILDAMYASKHIFVIVSSHLMKDQWCKFQVDVAIDRSIELEQRCLLFVVLENIEFKAVSKSWCVLLTKTPTVHWSSSKDEGDIKRTLFELTVKQQLGKPFSLT